MARTNQTDWNEGEEKTWSSFIPFEMHTMCMFFSQTHTQKKLLLLLEQLVKNEWIYLSWAVVYFFLLLLREKEHMLRCDDDDDCIHNLWFPSGVLNETLSVTNTFQVCFSSLLCIRSIKRSLAHFPTQLVRHAVWQLTQSDACSAMCKIRGRNCVWNGNEERAKKKTQNENRNRIKSPNEMQRRKNEDELDCWTRSGNTQHWSRLSIDDQKALPHYPLHTYTSLSLIWTRWFACIIFIFL